MALVSVRKKHLAHVKGLARALSPSELTPGDYLLFLVTASTMILLIVVLIQVTFQTISYVLTQSPDEFLRWYANRDFNGVPIVVVLLSMAVQLTICIQWSLYAVVTFFHLKLIKPPQFRRHARDNSHAQDYRRELPSAEFHPVVVSIYLNDQQLPDDILIELLHLAALDVVRITGSLDESSPDYHLPSVEKGFFIHTKPTAATQSETEKALTSKIDRAAFQMLCSLADANGVVTLEQLIQTIEQDFFQSKSPLSKFYRSAAREYNKSYLVRIRGATREEDDSKDLLIEWFEGLWKPGIPWFFAMIVFTFTERGVSIFYCLIPPAILTILLFFLWAISWVINDWGVRTDDGYRVFDECRACKRWMEDFTALRQAQAGATVTWDDYLTYAYVLEANETLVADMWQAGGALIENISASFIAKNGRPHFWWRGKRRMAYKRKWESALEEL